MSAQPKSSDPSMEEILASIRRIISDDSGKPNEPSAPAVAPEPPAPPKLQLVAEPDDDVLDLGAEAARVGPADMPVIRPAAAQAPAPVAPIMPPRPPIDLGLDLVEPSPAVNAAVAPAFDMTALLSEQAGSAVHNAFGALAHTVLTNNARTLEDLVKDMLRPMLKTWLDDNLPTLVERLVRAEIERVARGGNR